MYIRYLLFAVCVAAFSSCRSDEPDIQTLCLRNDIGNYVLKWETDPPLEGKVKVYVSGNPDMFYKGSPAATVDISDGITTYITDDNITQKYFQLVFNDKYCRTVGSRAVLMDSVDNFRDLGGYQAGRGKFTRWGKIYRSGRLGKLSDRDTVRLDNLKIKTIIDLRSDEEWQSSPLAYKKAKVIRIPVDLGAKTKSMYERIYDGQIRMGDSFVFMQDLYLYMITDPGKQKEFARALEVFLDKDNYPILFNCSLGKDRAGFLAALLLAALDVPDESIVQDYAITNDYLDLKRFQSQVHQLNSDSQEALTVILSSNESFMEFTLKMIRKEYGSVDKYFHEELGFSEDKMHRLKEIMLF